MHSDVARARAVRALVSQAVFNVCHAEEYVYLRAVNLSSYIGIQLLN